MSFLRNVLFLKTVQGQQDAEIRLFSEALFVYSFFFYFLLVWSGFVFPESPSLVLHDSWTISIPADLLIFWQQVGPRQKSATFPVLCVSFLKWRYFWICCTCQFYFTTTMSYSSLYPPFGHNSNTLESYFALNYCHLACFETPPERQLATGKLKKNI